MAGELDGTEVADKVSVGEFEKEFGLEGNTPAAESDAANEVASGESTLDDIERETTELDGIDTKTVERAITTAEALEGLDDNLERMEKEEELQNAHDAEDAEEAADDSDADDDGDAEGDVDTDTTEDAGGDEAAADDAEAGSEEDAGEEAAADDAGSDTGDAGEASVSDMTSWVRENLDDDQTSDLLQSLTDEGAVVPLKAHGKTSMVPLKEVLARAAGYAGQEEVGRRSQEATTQMTQAKKLTTEAEAATQHAQDMVESITGQIDDPEKFGDYLTGAGSLEYLKSLHAKLDATLQEAEENPAGFAMNRRLGGIENALKTMMDGGSAAAEETTDGGASDAAATPQLDPANIPDDLGFIQGQGYPAAFTLLAKRDTMTLLKAARAVGGPEVTYDDAVAAWVKEGKTRPITDVATGLLQSRKRDVGKKAIATTPPRKKTPTGRHKTGKKPSGRAQEASTEWDDIPKQLERDLVAQQQASELES